MTKSGLAATLGGATLAFAMSLTASHAGYMQPGETMGVSLLSPLPQGVYFADLEDYGRSNLAGVGAPKVGLGVNIPVIIWSTPWSFNNTRVEVLFAAPFAHLDGAGLDRVGAITYALGPMLAHDFGNGLTGGLGAFVRTPDPSADIQELTGRSRVAADFRESLQFKIPTGPFSGITLMQNAAFTSCLCSYGPTTLTNAGVFAAVQNDMFAGDFAATKTFGKFTFGFTGYGNIDTNNRAQRTGVNPNEKNIALGGLVGYDFGRFSLTAIVTHSLFRNAISPTVSVGEETRGWLRLVVPLLTAPEAAAPVVARY